jgi:hypothetical protein
MKMMIRNYHINWQEIELFWQERELFWQEKKLINDPHIGRYKGDADDDDDVYLES